MRYEAEEQRAECTGMCLKETKPIAPTLEDTIDAIVEIHGQLSGLSEFLFGDPREPFERPTTSCLSDAVSQANSMTKYALERIMRIKGLLGA